MGVQPLHPDDETWIAESLVRATERAREHGDPPTSARPSLEALDAMWAAGLGDPAQANELINRVGLAIGQHLVDQLGFAWVAVSDEYGTDVGVYGQPGDVVICPTSLVAKRWERKQAPFVVETVAAIIADIERLRGA